MGVLSAILWCCEISTMLRVDSWCTAVMEDGSLNGLEVVTSWRCYLILSMVSAQNSLH